MRFFLTIYSAFLFCVNTYAINHSNVVILSNDVGNYIDSNGVKGIDAKTDSIFNNNGHKYTVVFTTSLNGKDLTSYSQELFKKYAKGREYESLIVIKCATDKDNSVDAICCSSDILNELFWSDTTRYKDIRNHVLFNAVNTNFSTNVLNTIYSIESWIEENTIINNTNDGTISYVKPNYTENGFLEKPALCCEYVYNFSEEFKSFFSFNEEIELENKLSAFGEKTSNKIVVIIVDDLAGYEPLEYATKIINDWGIGTKELNNGVVLLIKPTGSAGERKVAIAVGWGLEGAIPDVTTSAIINNELIPLFKKEKYYEAINSGTNVLMKLAVKEYSKEDYDNIITSRLNILEKIINKVFHYGLMPIWGIPLVLFIILVLLMLSLMHQYLFRDFFRKYMQGKITDPGQRVLLPKQKITVNDNSIIKWIVINVLLFFMLMCLGGLPAIVHLSLFIFYFVVIWDIRNIIKNPFINRKFANISPTFGSYTSGSYSRNSSGSWSRSSSRSSSFRSSRSSSSGGGSSRGGGSSGSW